jgi:broad specificity phosphatase PhoE
MSTNAINGEATSQIFIIMRHAEAEKGEDPSLVEKGKVKAKKAAEAIQEIAKVNGKSNIQLVVSPLKRSQETAAVMAAVFKTTTSPAIEVRIQERHQTSLTKEERKSCEAHQKYKSIKDPKERFYAVGAPGAETGESQYLRMKEGVIAQLDAAQDSLTMPVFVAHQTAMKSLFQGLTYSNQMDGEAEKFFKKSHNCEIFVIERKDGRFVALDRKQISLAKL